jgi:hypothetical protein
MAESKVQIRPALGIRRPLTARMSVDFPAPVAIAAGHVDVKANPVAVIVDEAVRGIVEADASAHDPALLDGGQGPRLRRPAAVRIVPSAGGRHERQERRSTLKRSPHTFRVG